MRPSAQGALAARFFHNDHPIVLELGCGKGEYTVALAEREPGRNFIGIDIKGARMWRGAKTVTERGMTNAAFLRTRIEFIDHLFGEGEVSEIWITFPDPQLKTRRAKKRLTSPLFLERYAQLLRPDGWLNLKTDSKHLYAYTNEVIRRFALPCEVSEPDIYGSGFADETLSVKTAYETLFSRRGSPSPTPASRWAGAATSPGSTGRRTKSSKRTTRRSAAGKTVLEDAFLIRRACCTAPLSRNTTPRRAVRPPGLFCPG